MSVNAHLTYLGLVGAIVKVLAMTSLHCLMLKEKEKFQWPFDN